MIAQEQLDTILKHPMFYPGLAVAGVVFLLLVLLKFLSGPRTPSSASAQEDGTKSLSGKRKKGKKQRSAQEKKASDSPRGKKETRKTGIDSLIETDTTVEGSKQEKKRDSKLKTKSKKKKNMLTRQEMIPSLATHEENLDGEWQTVSTKEQREQLKREKKKQEEENDAITMERERSDPVPLVQPALKPPTNISAIAKGIAPRFAKAAGEQWQGKGPSSGNVPQSKRPMPPTMVPGLPKQTVKSSTVNQPWPNEPQSKPLWPTELASWPNHPETNNSAISAEFGMTWNPSDTSPLLNMATSSDKCMPSWPQSSWQTQGNGAAGTIRHMGADDWVDVGEEGQNGRSLTTGHSPIRESGLNAKKDEPWTLEPEGFPVEPPQLDPNDPWNIEVVERVDEGDWSAPVSSWDNTTDEWKAPEPVKHEPTYIYESSDEESSKAILRSGISHSQNNSALTTSPNMVVGAGPDFLSQVTSQVQNKKARRKRKKKSTTASEPEQLTSTSPLESTEKAELTEKVVTKVASMKKQTVMQEKIVIKSDITIEEQTIKSEPSVEQAKDDWTVTKTPKKKKPKARKAD